MRSWTLKDAPTLYKLTDDNRNILKIWLTWVPDIKGVEDIEKFIKRCRKGYQKGTSLETGLWHKGKLIGCIGFNRIYKQSKKATIGYWLSKDYQGKGVMTESVKALIKYGFGKLNLNRIDLKAGEKNTKSRAIPERLGFKKEGTLREDQFVDNRFINQVIYSVLKKDWTG